MGIYGALQPPLRRRSKGRTPDALLTEGEEEIITEAGEVIIHEDTESSFYFLDATSGDDSNSGKGRSIPWKTLEKLRTEAGNIASGAVVRFKAGEVFTHTGAIIEFLPGVTYGRYGASATDPILEGSDRITGWTVQSGNVYKATTTIADHADGRLWENGTLGTRVTSLAAVNGVRKWFKDDGIDTLYYWASDGADPDTHTINFIDSKTITFQLTGNDGRFENITIQFVSQSCLISNESGVSNAGWVILDCQFSRGGFHGIGAFTGDDGSKMTITRCTFDNNTEIGITLGKHVGSVVEDCLAHNNGKAGISLGTGDAPSGTTGNIIRRCIARNNGSTGVGCRTSTDGDLIERNTVFENAEDFDDHSGIKTFGINTTIRFNESYDNNRSFPIGHGIQLEVDSDNCQVYGNRCYGNISAGISIWGKNHEVYHNVCDDNDDAGISLFGTSAVDGLRIKNNIVTDNGGASGLALWDTNNRIDASSSDVEVKNNILRNTSATNVATWGGSTYDTLSALETGEATVSANLGDDPSFVDGPNADYRINTGSPAASAGDGAVNILEDLNGTSFDADNPNIGAYADEV